MTSTEERNLRAKLFVTDCLNKAKAFNISEEIKLKFSREIQIIDRMIPISVNGFRGVVLTAIVGIFLDENFKPLVNFYTCNPRSIFEQAIFYALQEANIPCGKSDPLNVAKNIQKLDYDWAKGRRPESAARAAVEYLMILDEARKDTARYAFLTMLFFRKLYEYGAYVNSLNSDYSIDVGTMPIQIANKLADFVVLCPEGGTVTQYILGEIIHLLRESDTDFKSVEGFKESVFGTNTTSKKPADIWEILSENKYGSLYEITVKKIDMKRIDDCIDALEKLNSDSKIVTFICNLPDDIENLNIDSNYMTKKGYGFQFIDIKQFVVNVFCVLTNDKQKTLLNKIEEFMHSSNRPIKTKKYWQLNFSNI